MSEMMTPGRPFAGLAERLRIDPPADVLLSKLRQQQESVENEMKILREELNVALSPQQQVTVTQTPQRQAPVVIVPTSPIISKRQQYTSPIKTVEIFAPSSPDHFKSQYDDVASPHELDYEPAEYFTNHNSKSTLEGNDLDFPSSPYAMSPLENPEDMPPEIPFVYSREYKYLESREKTWNTSTKVVHPNPQKRKLRRRDRPQPLYTGPRPKSQDFGFYRNQRIEPSEDSINDRFLDNNGVLFGDINEMDFEYLPERRDRSPIRQHPNRTNVTSRTRTPTASSFHQQYLRRRTNVRSRSPEMDLVSRPPKFFDPNMSSKSFLNIGSVLSTSSQIANPPSTSSLGAPLRGELAPVVTKGGLWATMPHSVKKLTRELNAYSR